MMGFAKSISRTPFILVVLLLVTCVGLSAWTIMMLAEPGMHAIVDAVVDRYDSLVPEITIKGGQASIKEKQPYSIDALRDQDVIFMIDTREGKQQEALTYLRDARVGAVLTRDELISKNGDQIVRLPLKDFPDITLNSSEIRGMVTEYMPAAVRIAWMASIIYCMLAKPIQALLLAMIPYFGARSYSATISFREAFSIAVFAMVPPVLSEFLLDLSGARIPALFVLYFAIYIGLLILAARDLARDSRMVGYPDAHAGPS